MAYASGTKILKPGGEKMDKFEETVSQVLWGRVVIMISTVPLMRG